MATLLVSEQFSESRQTPREIEVPAPTAWPFVLAFGCTLLFAGLVTNVSLSLLGAVLSLAGSIGWFREVFPHEREVTVPVVAEDIRITTERRVVERVPIPDYQRAWLPVHTYPVSAGVKGGLAGSVAMAVLACLYGILKAGSIWYPINLLAASVYAESLKLGPAQLYSFHADSFAIALGLHALVSTLVGLLYGAMLPMFPRRPIVLGGLIAPVLWSALIYTMLGLLNPMLESHIDWYWFVASQVGFGIVAGLVVVRQSRMLTRENLPFAMRAGVEAPGMISSHGEERPLTRLVIYALLRHSAWSCSLLATLRPADRPRIRKTRLQVRSATSRPSTQKTAQVVTARPVVREQQLRWPTRFILPSLMNLRCAKSSPTAYMERRCRPSRKAREEC
jgi:hypothetical protein